MINLQATSCTNKAPGTLIKLFAGCQTQAGRWAELSGWISICPLATLLLNGRKRGRNTHRKVFSSLNHSRILWRGNDVPGAGWSQLGGSGAPNLHRGWVCVLGFTSIVCNSFQKPGRGHFFLFFFPFLKRSCPFPFNKFSWPPFSSYSRRAE